jgi:DNA-directed RNA polymerase specialized sigma subunit
MGYREKKMEIKKGYDFLNRIRTCDNKIRRLRYTLAELRSCELPRGGEEGPQVQRSRSGSQVERIAERIVQLETEIKEAIEQKSIAVMEVDEALNKLPEGAEKTILYDCYVARIPMRKISETVGYSLKHCYKLRKKGIERMEELS